MLGTGAGTMFVPLYSILPMAQLKDEILSEKGLKSYLWRRYIYENFFLWEHGQEELI